MSDEKRLLYDRLPSLYKRQDNINDGELLISRLLRLFEDKLNLIYDDIKKLPNIRKIDKADYKFLPYIAQFRGIDFFDYNLDEKYARNEIKNINAFYDLKGTWDSIESFIRTSSGFESSYTIDYETYIMNIHMYADINDNDSNYKYNRLVSLKDRFIPIIWTPQFQKSFLIKGVDNFKLDYKNFYGTDFTNAASYSASIGCTETQFGWIPANTIPFNNGSPIYRLSDDTIHFDITQAMSVLYQIDSINLEIRTPYTEQQFPAPNDDQYDFFEGFTITYTPSSSFDAIYTIDFSHNFNNGSNLIISPTFDGTFFFDGSIDFGANSDFVSVSGSDNPINHYCPVTVKVSFTQSLSQNHTFDEKINVDVYSGSYFLNGEFNLDGYKDLGNFLSNTGLIQVYSSDVLISAENF